MNTKATSFTEAAVPSSLSEKSRKQNGRSRSPRSREDEARRLKEVRRRRQERISEIDVRDLPEILEAPEVARLLRISVNAVYAAASRREIPCLRLGRTLRFSREAVLQSLGAQDHDFPPTRRAP